jgi:hypothetical protein
MTKAQVEINHMDKSPSGLKPRFLACTNEIKESNKMYAFVRLFN